jgi:choline dehydrogenase
MPSITLLPAQADTIVIGAGTGGAALTGVLAENSTEEILLLEAGPDYGSFIDGRWPKDLLDAKAIPLSHDWDLITEAPVGRALDLPRAKVMGGCSSHNGCTASLGAAADYDDWSTQGNPGWDSDTVEPLLHWVHDRFRVRRYGMSELTVAQAAFVGAGLRSGLPFADDLDELAAGIGIGPMPVNVVDGVRWNASFAFIDPVRDRPHLRIAGDSLVTRLIFDHGSVTGVEVFRHGETHVIRAGRVVVAAGAIHTPALLMRSGLGTPSDLRQLDINLVAELPGVGQHLLDHPCVQLDFHGRPGLLDELARTPWNPDEQTVGRARSSRCDTGPYDIHVFMVAGANSGHPGLPPISLYAGAMRAVSEGHVRLASPDPHTRPAIDHQYGTDPDGHDLTVLNEALNLLHHMTHDRELSEILGEPSACALPPLQQLVNYCHPAGSCKLGPTSDPGAVVNFDGAVHGVDNLYVADASIMPSITRGNPNLPTAMIGARVASHLLKLTPAQVAGAARIYEQP